MLQKNTRVINQNTKNPPLSEVNSHSYTDQIFELLKKEFGQVSTPLKYSKPYELCIAVILSAQCTDERVNKVTPKLFERFSTLESFAYAEPKELETFIYSTGFYKNKTKAIIGFCKKLLEEYNGILPKTLQELVQFPGVGRKTANVILNEIYGISEGIVVDTHVIRLSRILGLTKSKNAEKIEKDLMKKFSHKQWKDISLYLIFLGRKYCRANKRICEICPLQGICPSSSV